MDYKNLISTISQGLAAFDAVYDRLARQNGLTYNALMVIYILFKQESVTQKALCEELFLSKSTVHSIVKGFIVDDILTFSEQKYGKEKELIFTVNGKKYAKNIMDIVQEEEMRLLQYLGEENCKELGEIALKLQTYYFENGVDA